MEVGKLYVVKLTVDEREELEKLTRCGKSYAWKIERAHALLKCDQGEQGPGWTDGQISDCFGMTTRCLENWRRQAVQEGPMSLFEPKRRAHPPTPPKLDGEGQAKLVKLACSPAPPGRASWSLRLLAERLVELQVVESISHEAVRRVLKKTKSSRGRRSSGV
jgi:hypothetical protein